MHLRFAALEFALLSLCVAGCGTQRMYDGPKRMPTEVALIELSRPFPAPKNELGVKEMTVAIVYLDKMKVKYNTYSDKLIEVLPGQHTATLSVQFPYKGSTRFVNTNARFTAVAGKQYRPKASVGGITYVEVKDLLGKSKAPNQMYNVTAEIVEVPASEVAPAPR